MKQQDEQTTGTGEEWEYANSEKAKACGWDRLQCQWKDDAGNWSDITTLASDSFFDGIEYRRRKPTTPPADQTAMRIAEALCAHPHILIVVFRNGDNRQKAQPSDLIPIIREHIPIITSVIGSGCGKCAELEGELRNVDSALGNAAALDDCKDRYEKIRKAMRAAAQSTTSQVEIASLRSTLSEKDKEIAEVRLKARSHEDELVGIRAELTSAQAEIARLTRVHESNIQSWRDAQAKDGEAIHRLQNELTRLRSAGGRLSGDTVRNILVTYGFALNPDSAKRVADELNAHLTTPWIAVTERMPVESDGDRNGDVFAYTKYSEAIVLLWNFNRSDVIAWRHTNLPEAKKVEDEDEAFIAHLMEETEKVRKRVSGYTLAQRAALEDRARKAIALSTKGGNESHE